MVKNIAPIWRCILTDGQLTILEQEKYTNYIKGLRPGELEMIVRRAKRSRSNPQNRYYWGCVLPLISEEIGILIYEEVHEMLKGIFLKRGVDYKGKRFEVIRSTADLSTMEFEEYLEKIRKWALIELNLLIPLPNEIMIEE